MKKQINLKLLASFLLFTGMMSLGPLAYPGTIEGEVILIDPALSRQNANSPFARSRKMAETVPHSHENGGEIIAVIWLDADEKLLPVKKVEEIPVVDQKDMTIVPHILPIPVGTTVQFHNSDNLYHNLFSLSPTRKFDLGRYGKGNEKQITFDDTGEVRIYCDIHPYMNSVVLVLPNSYFTEVHQDGMFKMENVPGGTYRIHAWHETYEEQVKEISVPDAGTISVSFRLGR